MFKLLSLIIIIILLYFGFYTLNSYDSIITIEIFEYVIQTNLSIFISSLLASCLILIITFNWISFILSIPNKIKFKIKNYREQNDNNNLLLSAFLLIVGDTSRLSKINNNLSEKNKDFYYLLKGETEKEFDLKINYYRQLLQSRNFKFYASKKIAQIYFEEKLYNPALEYAILAFNIQEKDFDINKILLDCYRREGAWDKFQYILLKTSNFTQLTPKQSAAISNFYLIIGKNFLEQGQIKVATKYIQEAMQYDPYNSEILDLYCTLKADQNELDSALINQIFIAFQKNPSFELVELYSKFSQASPFEQLNMFNKILTNVDNKGLILAISHFYNNVILLSNK